jgi:two-component system response regulator AtoC
MDSDQQADPSLQETVKPLRILIVEDELIFARAVSRRLEREGYVCQGVGSLRDALSELAKQIPDLILLDMRLPDGSGLDFLQQIRELFDPAIPVIVMTAYGEVEDAVTAMKLSALDYLKKPFDLDELLLAVDKFITNQKVSIQLTYSRAREAHGSDIVSIDGETRVIQNLRAEIAKIAKLCSVPVLPPPTVLITGSTGTGKDVAARMLHYKSDRRDKPFVHVDCASLPKDLIDAELFGHVKGAFTNAHAQRLGLIEMAEDGVVFLDEIGELPLELQAKLLAVLERRMLRRVGSSRELPIEAWFIAATNRDVKSMVKEGTLRSDLYFRLNVLGLELPPLQDRADDILLLSEIIGQQVARRHGIPRFELSDGAKKRLLGYEWPGNVRELRHVIERATLLSGDGKVAEEGLMLPVVTSSPPLPTELLGLTLAEAERVLILEALKQCGSNVSAASRRLGITRMAMRYRMKQHDIM